MHFKKAVCALAAWYMLYLPFGTAQPYAAGETEEPLIVENIYREKEEETMQETTAAAVILGAYTKLPCTLPDPEPEEQDVWREMQLYAEVEWADEEETEEDLWLTSDYMPEELPDIRSLSTEWIRMHTEYDSFAAWQKGTRDQLREEREADAREILIESLVEVSEISIHGDALQQKADALLAEYTEMSRMEHVTLAEFVEGYLGMDAEELNRQLQREAEEIIRRGAVIRAFVQAEELNTGQEAYEKFLEEEAVQYGYESGSAYLEDMKTAELDQEVYDAFLEKTAGDRLFEIYAASTDAEKGKGENEAE